MVEGQEEHSCSWCHIQKAVKVKERAGEGDKPLQATSLVTCPFDQNHLFNSKSAISPLIHSPSKSPICECIGLLEDNILPPDSQKIHAPAFMQNPLPNPTSSNTAEKSKSSET